MKKLSVEKIVQKRKNFIFLVRSMFVLLIISLPVGLYIEATTSFSFSAIGLALAFSVFFFVVYNKKQIQEINSILLDDTDAKKYLKIMCGLQNKREVFSINKAAGNYYLGNFEAVISLLNKINLSKATNNNTLFVYYLYGVTYLFLEKPKLTKKYIQQIEVFIENKKLNRKDKIYGQKLLNKLYLFYSIIYLKKDSTEVLNHFEVSNKLFEIEKKYLEIVNESNIFNSCNESKQIANLKFDKVVCDLFYVKDIQRFLS